MLLRGLDGVHEGVLIRPEAPALDPRAPCRAFSQVREPRGGKNGAERHVLAAGADVGEDPADLRLEDQDHGRVDAGDPHDLGAGGGGDDLGRGRGIDPSQGHLDRLALARLTLEGALQGAFARDVAVGLHVARHPAGRVPEPRDDGLDLEGAAVLPPVDDRAGPRPTGPGRCPDLVEEADRVRPAVDDAGVPADDLVGFVAVGPGEGLVDVADVVVEVLHPDRVGGLLDGGRQPGPLVLGVDALGDVQARSDQADRRTARVSDDLGRLVDDADGPVGPHDPILGFERRLGGQPDGCRGGEVPIVGVDEAEEGVEGSGERSRRDAHDPARLVAPPQLAGDEVPLPAADVRDPLGLFEMARVGRRDQVHRLERWGCRGSRRYDPIVRVRCRAAADRVVTIGS